MTIKLRQLALGLVLAGFAAGIAVLADEQTQRHYPPPFPRDHATKILENNRVIVWDVVWPKGYTTPVHEHYLDHVSITITGGTVKMMNVDGTSRTVTVKAGSVGFAPKGVVHQEQGVSEIPRHAVIVELK